MPRGPSRPSGRRPIIKGMTTSTAHARRVLVPATAATARPSDDQVRRYRLARLRLDTLRRDTSGPFGHLKRSYD